MITPSSGSGSVIYTFAVLYSGKGSTISHMAYDDLQIVVVFAKELCGSLGYEFMKVPWKPYLRIAYFS